MSDLTSLVERLANECGLDRREGDVGGFTVGYYLVSDMKFRTLILKVAEECASLCEEKERLKWQILRDGGKLEGFSAMDCAKAIRERFTPSDTAPSPQPEPPAT